MVPLIQGVLLFQSFIFGHSTLLKMTNESAIKLQVQRYMWENASSGEASVEISYW